MKKQVILCVDDEKIVLSSLVQEMESAFKYKYLYEVAEDVEEALEIIKDYQYSDTHEIVLVITDWLMPQTKGDVFLLDLYQNHPHIKTIMLTGQANEEAIASAFEYANLSACLKKPWRAEDLIRTIEKTLQLIPTK